MVKEQREKYMALLILLLLVVVIVAVTVLVVRKDRLAHNPAAEVLGGAEGAAQYTDLSGNPLALTDHIGKVLIVNSWASWSPDSARELPLLAEVAMEYKDRDVKVIAINRAEPQTTAERFLKTVGVADEVQLVLDPDDRYYRSVSGYAMPETVIYDARGNVVQHHHGVLTAAQLKEYVDTALQAE